MNTTVKSALLMLPLLISAGAVAPAVSAPAGDTPEHCQKKCMGNDTPTERANCLKTCPQANAPARTMSELPANNPPPTFSTWTKPKPTAPVESVIVP